MGDVKIHHFAHSKDACDEVVAYTTGLHKLIQQTLSDGTPFYIPGLAILVKEAPVDSAILFNVGGVSHFSGQYPFTITRSRRT